MCDPTENEGHREEIGDRRSSWNCVVWLCDHHHKRKTEFRIRFGEKKSVPLSPKDMEWIKSSVKGRLKDPNSAMFSSIVATTEGGIIQICGFVNAKNSFGGYTGPQLFYVPSFRNKNGELEMSLIYINDIVALRMSEGCSF